MPYGKIMILIIVRKDTINDIINKDIVLINYLKEKSMA